MSNNSGDILWGMFCGCLATILIVVWVIEGAEGYHHHGVSDMEQRAVDRGVAEYVLIGDSPKRQFIWKSN